MSETFTMPEITTTIPKAKLNPFDVMSGVGNFVNNVFNTGYSVYQDQRNFQYQQEQDQRNYDESVRQYEKNFSENVRQYEKNFDYNKALQQQIFDREDTAVQRRMADLQSAGLNPNLAAGSAAGAGSVVSQGSHGVSGQSVGSAGVSGHNLIPLGSILDTVKHVESMKQMKLQTEILKWQKEKAHEDYVYASYDAADRSRQSELNNQYFKYMIRPEDDTEITSRFQRLLDYDFLNQKNSSHILQTQSNWALTNEIIDAISDSVDIGSDIVGGVTGVKRAFNPVFKPQFLKTEERYSRNRKNYSYSQFN